MGWAGGSQLSDELWKVVKKYIPEKDLKKVAMKWVDCFENEDCDTMYETQIVEEAGLTWDDDNGGWVDET